MKTQTLDQHALIRCVIRTGVVLLRVLSGRFINVLFYKHGVNIQFLSVPIAKLVFYFQTTVCWLVGFGFNGPLRQYFSLYRAVSQREGERKEKRYTRLKMSKQPQPAPTANAVGPCPTVIQIVRRPGTGSLPSTIAPPDHSYHSVKGDLIVELFRIKKYKFTLPHPNQQPPRTQPPRSSSYSDRSKAGFPCSSFECA